MKNKDYIKPFSLDYTKMIENLPDPIVLLEIWTKNKPSDIIMCEVLDQQLDSSNTNNKGICVVDFVLKADCCYPTIYPTMWSNIFVKMFYRRWEYGTYLIEENGLPHYSFVAMPTDLEYKVLNISSNTKHIYVKGELVSI